MPLTVKDIEIIHKICSQLQPRLLESLQVLGSNNEFRTSCLLTDKIYNNRTCDFVFINIPNFNNWHKKIIEKRKKEISAQTVIETFENNKITRITFK